MFFFVQVLWQCKINTTFFAVFVALFSAAKKQQHLYVLSLCPCNFLDGFFERFLWRNITLIFPKRCVESLYTASFHMAHCLYLIFPLFLFNFDVCFNQNLQFYSMHILLSFFWIIYISNNQIIEERKKGVENCQARFFIAIGFKFFYSPNLKVLHLKGGFDLVRESNLYICIYL